MAQLMLNYTFEEKSIELQKCCLGGKMITQDDINARLDTSDDNFFNSCWRCYMKGHKIHGQCDTDGCPVKYAHRKVVNTLFKLADILEEKPEVNIPSLKVTEYTLDYIIEFYEEFVNKTNTSHLTGLDKIKNLFGGK